MPSTPIYGWPYQGRYTNPIPYSMISGEAYLLAIEATIVAIEAARAARMGFSLRRVANQTLPDAAFTPVSWDTEDVDTHGVFTPHATTATTITLPADGAGLWAISTTVFPAAAATGLGMVTLTINGSEACRFPIADNVMSAAITLPLAGSSTIVVQPFRDGAGSTTMTGTFYAYRVGL